MNQPEVRVLIVVQGQGQWGETLGFGIIQHDMEMIRTSRSCVFICRVSNSGCANFSLYYFMAPCAVGFSGCPGAWEKFSEKCYYFSLKKLNWAEARKDCQSMGADLIVIGDAKEQVRHSQIW